MEMYIKSTQYNVWGIITHGDKMMDKPKKDYTQDNYNTLQLNARERCCDLSKYEYNKFCSYKITKDMWDVIQITYEGKEDMFTMKEDRIINEMLGRFQTILNGLSFLCHKFSKAQNNLKILNSLPKV
ncbi:hypothetical protein CR513_23045, partial [Mucuna pruriens]